MPLGRVINSVVKSPYFQIALFVVLFLVTRLPYLGRDTINPDAVNWHYRSEQFIVGLKSHQWARTYQHYHPGVTLMWIMGSAIEVIRQINPSLRVYTHENFLLLHTAAKYTLVFVQLLLSLGLIWILRKILGFSKGLLLVAFFSLETFFIGNSRMLHMDILLTLLLLIGLSLAYLAVSASKKKTQKIYTLFAGIFIGLSFLTKSIAVGGFLFVLGFLSFTFWRNPKKLLTFIGFFVAGFISIIFLAFPAMWVSPLKVILDIFTEADRIGIRKGHEQIFFGHYSLDPGFFFYPVLFFLKTSPFLFIGFLLSVFQSLRTLFHLNLKSLWKEKKVFSIGYTQFLSIFFLGYMIVMTISTKKIDRYLLPAFPWFALVSLIGYEKTFSQKARKWLIPFGLVGLLILNFAFYPFQFTYTTPFVGSPKNAHALVAQKPFGVGIPDLQKTLFEKYGDFPTIAFYDTKPMSMIYISSRIFDIEITSPDKYDIVILGPNEEMPHKVLESGYDFKLDEVIEINGLDYWRIYVKEGFSGK
jgi:hypothetical protein